MKKPGEQVWLCDYCECDATEVKWIVDQVIDYWDDNDARSYDICDRCFPLLPKCRADAYKVFVEA